MIEYNHAEKITQFYLIGLITLGNVWGHIIEIIKNYEFYMTCCYYFQMHAAKYNFNYTYVLNGLVITRALGLFSYDNGWGWL